MQRRYRRLPSRISPRRCLDLPLLFPQSCWLLSYLFRGLSAVFTAAVVCSIVIARKTSASRVFDAVRYRDCVVDCFNTDHRSRTHARCMAQYRSGNSDGRVLLSIVGAELVEILVAYRRGVRNSPVATAL